ncbi:MAG: site-2 protease family protein, partial [Firmicutes bacterium]|nr:site-2 protease family protein [Bacillota bacterium]
TFTLTKQMYVILKQIFTGEVSASELSGPVGIVYVVNQSISQGMIYFFYLLAMLSLNLAVINLLPFPALDGGRLLFIVIRKITGKAVSDEVEGRINLIGLMLLFALMIYVTGNDIIKFVLPALGK